MTDDDYERCLRVLHSWQAPHNIRHYCTKAGVVRAPWFVQVVVRAELATFDGDELTRLVMAAHRERVRLAVIAHCRGHLRLLLHPRQTTGSSMERHPGPERLVTP